MLLSFVGVARYVSADQVHRLFFEGSSKKQTYRRLSKLCEPGGKPGEGPCLRRLEYRRREGTAVPVWALAPWGRVVATKAYPFLRPPASSDIGHQFLEHTLLLNDVLAGLVLRLRSSPESPLSGLPFDWLSEDDETLQFEWSSLDRQPKGKSLLKPDAIVEGKLFRRRLFLEAETGSQSIATSHPERGGAIVAKVRRYLRFATGLVPGTQRTYYDAAFDDSLPARLVFLVHSAERKDRVEKVVAEAFRIGERDPFKVMALTFDEAPDVLASYLVRGILRPPTAAERPRIIAVDALEADRIGRCMDEVEAALRRLGTVAAAGGGPGQVTPGFPHVSLVTLRRFIHEEVRGKRLDGGASPKPEGGPWRATR
ncbi:MAG: replication-relaxation family protein [Anaeromyxobacteraceae bacterium]